jgi:hypothetical protein
MIPENSLGVPRRGPNRTGRLSREPLSGMQAEPPWKSELYHSAESKLEQKKLSENISSVRQPVVDPAL